MNATHLHLVLNHILVLGTWFELFLFGFGLWRGDDEIKKSALAGLVVFAILAMATYLTGEPAEALVDPLPGVSRTFLGRHGEAAGVALTAMVMVGLAALLGLVRFRRARPLPAWFSVAILGMTVVAGSLMGWAANVGGLVRPSGSRAADFTVVPSADTGQEEEKR